MITDGDLKNSCRYSAFLFRARLVPQPEAVNVLRRVASPTHNFSGTTVLVLLSNKSNFSELMIIQCR